MREMPILPILTIVAIAHGFGPRQATPRASTSPTSNSLATHTTTTSSDPIGEPTILTSTTSHVTSSGHISYQTVKETIIYTATPSMTARAGNENHTGLSSGGIVGIVIAIIVVLLAAAGLAFFSLRQRRRRRQRNMLRDAGIISPATESARHDKDGNSMTELRNQPLPFEASSNGLHEMGTPASELEGQMPERYQKAPVEIGAKSIVESSVDERRYTRSLKLDPNMTESWLDTDP